MLLSRRTAFEHCQAIIRSLASNSIGQSHWPVYCRCRGTTGPFWPFFCRWRPVQS